MTIFIRFDENNQRIETTTLTKKPDGEGWYKAPADFDWAKTYVLKEGQVIESANEEVLQ